VLFVDFVLWRGTSGRLATVSRSVVRRRRGASRDATVDFPSDFVRWSDIAKVSREVNTTCLSLRSCCPVAELYWLLLYHAAWLAAGCERCSCRCAIFPDRETKHHAALIVGGWSW